MHRTLFIDGVDPLKIVNQHKAFYIPPPKNRGYHLPANEMTVVSLNPGMRDVSTAQIASFSLAQNNEYKTDSGLGNEQ